MADVATGSLAAALPPSSEWADMYQRPEWQRRRLQMLDAAHWMCQCCFDSEKSLHVHHRRYIKGRRPWEYDDDDLVVLCKDCHQSQHAEQDEIKRVIARMPMAGPGQPDELLALLRGLAVEIAPIPRRPHHLALLRLGLIVRDLLLYADHEDLTKFADDYVAATACSDPRQRSDRVQAWLRGYADKPGDRHGQ